MQPTEVSLSIGERRRMKKVVRRVYNRLIVESSRFSATTDQVQNMVLALGGIAIIAAATFGVQFAAKRLAAWALTFEATPEPAMSALHFVEDNAILPALAAALILVLFFMRGISTLFFEKSGDYLVWKRKFFGSLKRKKQLLEIIDAWLTQQPDKVRLVHDYIFRRRPEKSLPRGVRKALLRHADGAAGPPALIIRHYAEKKYWPLYIARWFRPPNDFVVTDDTNYFRSARGYRNAIRIALLFDVLGAELRDELLGGSRWRRNYLTDFDRQHTSLFDPDDIQLRFRSATPHYRWPYSARPSSQREMANFRVIMCLENPVSSPFYIISAQEIVDAFPRAACRLFPEDCAGDDEASLANREAKASEAIEMLLKKDVPMYGKRSPSTLRATSDAGVEPEPVLKNLNEGQYDENGAPLARDYALKWDPNYINWSEIVDPGGEIPRALAMLVAAIDIVSRDAKPIILSRGDVALIDNRRSLVGRREWSGGAKWIKDVLWYPERWWMRGYYGFRKSERSPDLLGS